MNSLLDSCYWKRKYAFYAASLLRLGDFVDAGFVAAVLFERYIEDELASFEYRRSRTGDFLADAIGFLASQNHALYNLRQLHEIRKIRNKYIIHCDDAFEEYDNPVTKGKLRREITKVVEFMWERLDPETFKEFGHIDGIPLLRADYAVAAVREFFQNDSSGIPSDERAIKMEDFEDLMHMRQHFLHLGDYIRESLLPKFPDLEVDLISRTDTTSAYVWLAVNLKKHSHDHKRDRVSQASASIMATPLDFRIFLGFGGEAYVSRKRYLEFIRTNEFSEFISSNPELCMFDVEWHCFIVNKRNAAAYITSSDYESDLKAANTKLEQCRRTRKIITWDRMLTGYVLDRQIIYYSNVVSKLESLLKFYRAIQDVKQN